MVIINFSIIDFAHIFTPVFILQIYHIVVKFANGLIIQWGLLSAASHGNFSTASFPIQYTNVPAIMVTTRGVSDSDYGVSMLGQVIGTKKGFRCDSNYGTETKVRLYWMSIGY